MTQLVSTPTCPRPASPGTPTSTDGADSRAASPVVRFTVRELHAAAQALSDGLFADTGPSPARRRRPGQRDAGPAGDGGPDARWGQDERVVRVLPAHAGAGASTLALALGDAATLTGGSSRLIDAATPESSGLLDLTTTEYGRDGDWHLSGRGSLRIERLARPVASPAGVPGPRPGGPGLTILDAGWSVRELRLHPRSWLTGPVELDVLVVRAHAQGLRRAEHTLRRLDAIRADRIQLAVIGSRREARRLHATDGPLIRQLADAHAVTRVPLLPRPPTDRSDGRGVPRRLLMAARRLLDAAVADPAEDHERAPGAPTYPDLAQPHLARPTG